MDHQKRSGHGTPPSKEGSVSNLRRADGYVDDVLRSIPPDVRDALSDDQFAALAKAVGKAAQGRRHMVDVRFSLPLYVTRLYCVFLIGQDRRTHVKRTFVDRRNQGRSAASVMLMSGMAIALAGTFLVGLILILYTAKSMMGIDLIPGSHFRDFLSGE